MKVDTSFNVLASYAYLGKDQAFCDLVEYGARNRKFNVMIDSGAFTAHNAKGGGVSHITLGQYCDFLSKYAPVAEKYVMLDVVGDDAASKRNYEEMCRLGFNPMFVATMFDRDFEYMAQAVERNRDICVAGGVTTKGDWMSQRFQRVYAKTGRVAQIHGLGYVIAPQMFQLPLKSVDSSSWLAGARYGQGAMWTPEHNVKWYSWKDYLKRGERMPRALQVSLDRIGVTPAMFLDEKNHQGGNNIENYLTAWSYLQFQRFAKQNHRDLFLAVPGASWLRQLMWLTENWRAPRYEDFLQL